MNKIMLTAVIVLPLVMFFAFFGERVLDNFIDNDNDMIDQQNRMLESVVGGQGWTDPGGWSVSE